jgi:hypothetical protein
VAVALHMDGAGAYGNAQQIGVDGALPPISGYITRMPTAAEPRGGQMVAACW